MTEYQIQPNTRRCAVSGRELQSGEKYYSVLIDKGGTLLRQDFAADAWHGPPDNAFSFWCGRVPTPERGQRPRIDDDLLADCFGRLERQTEPAQVNFRYVVGLLLMRRRRLKLEETRVEAGQETLRLRCARTGAVYAMVNPGLPGEEMARIQEEVFKVLGWE